MLSTQRILRAIPSENDICDYANALLSINKYAYAISSQNVPDLKSPPARYSEYVTQFVNAQTMPNQWSQIFFGQMVSTPSSILNYTAPFGILENDLNRLIQNPNDVNSKNRLKKDFTNIQNVFDIENNNIQNIFSFLTDFSSKIGRDANTLTNLSDEALQLVEYDQIKIANLQVEINELKRRISVDEKELKISDFIGKTVNLILEVVGIGCAEVTDVILKEIEKIINITHFGTSGSVVQKLILEDIVNLQNQIINDSKEIADKNQDVILLTNFSTQFEDLNSTCSQSQNSLTKILNMWQTLSNAIAYVSNELNVTEYGDLKAQDYVNALDDLQKIEASWAKLVDGATGLANISFKWQDASGNWCEYGVANPQSNTVKINVIPTNK
jgi:hypothetical protein